MELGQKIRQLRTNKGVTQEALACALGVTYQAVSRWENELTMPDITLLPKISTCFGVSIDELFEFTPETQLERIRNMLSDKAALSDSEFGAARSFLEKQLRVDSENVEAVKLLAWLYAHRTKSDTAIAVEYAKMAQRLGDTSKSMNNILRDAYGVPHSDWNYRNRHELIDYYYAHIKAHPDDNRAYLYLVPALIADGRTAKAEKLLADMKKTDSGLRIMNFKGLILEQNGDLPGALAVWTEMTEKYSDDWLAWACCADNMAGICRYDEAIELYEKAFSLQEKPRFTDSLEAISHIYEINGEYQKAIEKTREIISLLSDDWGVAFGATVEKYKERIKILESK